MLIIVVIGAVVFALWFLARKGRAEKHAAQVQRDAAREANKSLRELNKSLGFPESTGPTGIMVDGKYQVVNVGHAHRMKNDPAYVLGGETAPILLEMNDLENALKEAEASGNYALVNKIKKELIKLEAEANTLIEQYQRTR